MHITALRYRGASNAIRSINPLGLTVLTVLLLHLWTDSAHAHSIPLFLLPVFGSFLFFPLALLSAFLGWLAKGLYYSDSSEKGLPMVHWSDALKEAGLVYACFILAAIVLDLGVALTMNYSRWWNVRGLGAALAATTVLSPLATMFLHRRFLERIADAKGLDSSLTANSRSVALLGLISPVIFLSAFWVVFGLEVR